MNIHKLLTTIRALFRHNQIDESAQAPSLEVIVKFGSGLKLSVGHLHFGFFGEFPQEVASNLYFATTCEIDVTASTEMRICDICDAFSDIDFVTLRKNDRVDLKDICETGLANMTIEDFAEKISKIAEQEINS